MKFGLQDIETLSKLNFRDPATWLATWFGCGLMRPGPGTWGTLGALPLGILLLIGGGPPFLILGTFLLLPLGYWAAGRVEKAVGKSDASLIVIDEAAGVLLALIPAGTSALLIVLSFLFFRLFDIWKPWPICWLDRKIKGPAGVMADDLLAGIFAALCVAGVKYAGLG